MRPFPNNYRRLFAVFYALILLLAGGVPSRAASGLSAAAIDLTASEKQWLDSKHTVRVRVGPWPPFTFTDGKVRGIAIDYLETIFNQLGIHYRYITEQEVSWKDALAHIRDHDTVDLVPTAKITPERQKDLAFTREYLFLPWVIFARKDSPFIAGMDDLKGKTVAVQRGYVMEEKLTRHYPEIKLHVVEGGNLTEQCIAALSTGMVDAFIGNLAVGTYHIQYRGYANVKVVAPTPFGNHDMAMALRNDWPELASMINKSLDAMPQTAHSEIMNRWLSVRYEHGIRKTDVLKWGMIVFGLVGLGFTAFSFWNRRLKREVSERKRAEEALREVTEKLRAIINASPEPITVLDRKGRVQLWSPAAEAVFGWREAEVMGRVIPTVVEETRDQFSELVARVLKGNALTGVQVRRQTKTGDGIDLNLSIAPLRDASGTIVGIVSIQTDITEIKRNEEERESLITELQSALKEIKTLTGLLPICSTCHKIRDDKGYWNRLEAYLQAHSSVEFSHGICPECAKKLYPDLDID